MLYEIGEGIMVVHAMFAESWSPQSQEKVVGHRGIPLDCSLFCKLRQIKQVS